MFQNIESGSMFQNIENMFQNIERSVSDAKKVRLEMTFLASETLFLRLKHSFQYFKTLLSIF